MAYVSANVLLVLALAVSPAWAQDRFDSTGGEIPRARIPVPPHTCSPACRGLQEQWRASCGQPGTERMARSMTLEMPGCPPCELQCADTAEGVKGIRRSSDCAEAAAKGLQREGCEDVPDVATGCEESGAKGIYRVECDPCVQAGAKGIVRVDCDRVDRGRDGQTVSPGPSVLIPAIDDCLAKSGLTYYTPPRTAVGRGAVSYDGAGTTILYDPTFLARQSSYVRAFWLGNAFAAHVVDLEQRQFGMSRTPAEAVRIRDYLTGYVAHCLARHGVLAEPVNRSRNDPRIVYASYLRDRPFALPGEVRDPRTDIADWKEGWRDYGMRVLFSLRHDPTLPPPPGDPFHLGR